MWLLKIISEGNWERWGFCSWEEKMCYEGRVGYMCVGCCSGNILGGGGCGVFGFSEGNLYVGE